MSEARNTLLAMPGVDPSLLPQGWVENHYRLVVVSKARQGKQGKEKTTNKKYIQIVSYSDYKWFFQLFRRNIINTIFYHIQDIKA